MLTAEHIVKFHQRLGALSRRSLKGHTDHGRGRVSIIQRPWTRRQLELPA